MFKGSDTSYGVDVPARLGWLRTGWEVGEMFLLLLLLLKNIDIILVQLKECEHRLRLALLRFQNLRCIVLNVHGPALGGCLAPFPPRYMSAGG